MALTRAQLLMGNSGQGTVLTGQVQAVRQGAGILIATDGTISVDASTVIGLMRLNNTTAYNSYTWPNTAGVLAKDTFLMSDGTGVLAWNTLQGRPVVTVSTVTPSPADVGELWFDCNTGTLKIYQTCTSPNGWTDTAKPGLEVLPANTTSSPPFINAGSPTGGTVGNPWLCTVTTIGSGGSTFVVNTVTITGLAPFQFVPIVDLNVATNGGRFSFTNNYANGAGVLVFKTVFNDNPTSPAGASYLANIKVGYNTTYINATVNIVATLIASGGIISGPVYEGQQLIYIPGSGIDGVSPYTYTYQWYANGVAIAGATSLTYTLLAAQVGAVITARTNVTDSIGQKASGISNVLGPILANPGPLTITSAGSISPSTGVSIGTVLTYSPGAYTGGIPTVTTSWVWKRAGVPIPGTADASTYITVNADANQPITVEFFAIDSSTPIPATGSLTTTSVTPIPVFPTSVWDPQPAGGLDEVPGLVSGVYNGTGTTITPSGCLEVSVNGGPFSTAPTSIATGQTLASRWDSSLGCGGAPSGTTITGSVTDGTYANPYSVTIDRVPSPFSFTPVTNSNLSTVITSNSVTLSGTNAPSYLTYGAASTGTAASFQASLDGGTTWLSIPSVGTGFPVPPGSTLKVRQTSSGSLTTATTLVVNVGDGDNGPNTRSSTFTVTTTNTPAFPNLDPVLSVGPDKIPEVVSGVWADGPQANLTSTGCMEISLDGITWGQGPLVIANGNTLYEQWNPVGGCGDAADGTTITGTLTNGTYVANYSLTLDRNPAAFTLAPITNQAVNSTASSAFVTLSGSNAPCYLTYTPGSPDTLTTVQVDINGAGFVAVPLTGTTLEIPPGASLQFQGDTGATLSTAYTVTFNYGTNTTPWSVTNTSSAPPAPPGLQFFTSPGTWTAPAGVTTAFITMIGGGASGRATGGKLSNSAGGGGGGQIYGAVASVVPGTSYPVTVGGGGAGGTGTGGTFPGNPGGSSSVAGYTVTGGGISGGSPSGNPGSSGAGSGYPGGGGGTGPLTGYGGGGIGRAVSPFNTPGTGGAVSINW